MDSYSPVELFIRSWNIIIIQKNNFNDSSRFNRRSGSGKSSVSEIFEGLGVKVVDADVASRQPVMKGQPALKKIAEKFDQIFLPLRENEIEENSEKLYLKRVLKRLVRKSTSSLIHQILIDDLATASSKYAILVSPLLFETNQKDLVQKQ